MKNIYAVLGASRSGTSAIARSLKVLGINMGDKLLPGNDNNPKGFWEDAEILYRINRGVSAHWNNPWMTVGMIDKTHIQQNPELRDYKNIAITIVQERLQDAQSWGFKDPRTTTILPFWQWVFEELAVDDRYVIVVRNPLAVAHSTQKFINTDIEMGLLIWLVHLFSAIEGTHGKKRIVVCYESMLQHPRLQLQRMQNAFAIADIPEREVETYASEFLDKQLHHHAFNEADLASHPAVAIAPLCLQLYDLLLQLGHDTLAFDSPEFQSAWQHIKAEFTKCYPVYDYIHTQFQQNHHLKREMKTMRKSIPWKIIYPLRKLDDTLRARRRKSKEVKRLNSEKF